MNKTIVAVVVAALLAAAGIALYIQGRALDAGENAGIDPASISPATETEKPAIQYPIPTEDTPQPAPELPPLDGSDSAVRDDLSHDVGPGPIEAFLLPEQIIRHFVATIDTLDRDAIPLRFRPIRHVPERPVVRTENGTLSLSPANADRYTPYVKALQAVDSSKLGALYLRYYPLFQKAYAELGYPDRYFNDRMVQIIDHLLATPTVDGPLPLLQPKVLYVFADPDLEQRSWGQKTLIRMGPSHATAVKIKLRDLRKIITARNPDEAPAAP